MWLRFKLGDEATGKKRIEQFAVKARLSNPRNGGRIRPHVRPAESFVGVSAAGALAGALKIAQKAGPGSVVLTIFPDSGDKYLSEHFWEDPA